MSYVKYETKYNMQKDVTFCINMKTLKIESFYNYITGKRIKYRIGKKRLNKAVNRNQTFSLK